jgi:hypothetical protein
VGGQDSNLADFERADGLHAKSDCGRPALKSLKKDSSWFGAARPAFESGPHRAPQVFPAQTTSGRADITTSPFSRFVLDGCSIIPDNDGYIPHRP